MTMARPMTGIHIALATPCNRAVRSMSTTPCSWSRSLSCVVTVVCCDSRALPRGPECSSLFMHATRNRAECDHKYWNFSDTSACRPTGRTGVGGGNVRGRRECVPSTPHRASAQHDRPLAREEHTPVAVPFHGVRQSLAFGVAAGGDEVLGCEGVVDLDELLGNDGALVEFAVDEVSGRPDGLHSPLPGLVVGLGSLERREERVVDVDRSAGECAGEIVGEDLHIAGQDAGGGREPGDEVG